MVTAALTGIDGPDEGVRGLDLDDIRDGGHVQLGRYSGEQVLGDAREKAVDKVCRPSPYNT